MQYTTKAGVARPGPALSARGKKARASEYEPGTVIARLDGPVPLVVRAGDSCAVVEGADGKPLAWCLDMPGFGRDLAVILEFLALRQGGMNRG